MSYIPGSTTYAAAPLGEIRRRPPRPVSRPTTTSPNQNKNWHHLFLPHPPPRQYFAGSFELKLLLSFELSFLLSSAVSKSAPKFLSQTLQQHCAPHKQPPQYGPPQVATECSKFRQTPRRRSLWEARMRVAWMGVKIREVGGGNKWQVLCSPLHSTLTHSLPVFGANFPTRRISHSPYHTVFLPLER